MRKKTVLYVNIKDSYVANGRGLIMKFTEKEIKLIRSVFEYFKGKIKNESWDKYEVKSSVTAKEIFYYIQRVRECNVVL